MFKKPDPWEAGLKMVSKFLGFDVQQQTPKNQKTKGGNGIISIRHSIQSQSFGKSEQKSYKLKEKWRNLMKFPSKIKYREVTELLQQGSAIQDETWVWMFRNSQKITPQLYTSKKQQFNQMIFSHNPLLREGQLSERNIQISDFEQTLQFKKELINGGKKRKFSITKNSTFMKDHPLSNGRLSLTSQASTFSSRTHNSNELIQLQSPQDTPMLNLLLCSQNSRIQSPQNLMKSSYMSVHSSPVHSPQCDESFNHVNAFVEQSYESISPSLMILPQKISHPVLTSIIGAFLLHRQDFVYSITLFNMTATFYYYTNSNEMKTFTLLNHVACSEFFVHYLTQNWQQSGRVIAYIADKVRRNCPSTSFMKNFRLQNFVENWLYGFFYSLCQNGTEIKEKIIGYLLINSFSIDSLAKVCESLIFSLGKVINQGYQDKIYECLQNPKFYIDKDVLFYHLLCYEE